MAHTHFEPFKKGCSMAFAGIHEQYRRRIYWLGKQLIQDDFVIETLVQDTFLKLWLHREQIKSPNHMYFFLRLVMKRACFSYHNLPKNKFFLKVNALESYENYQDYLASYDPKEEDETLKAQVKAQQQFDRVNKVLPLLSAESNHLITLCLKYNFAYKKIAEGLGTSISETSLKVKRAIKAIKTILDHEGTFETQNRTTISLKDEPVLTEQQAAVLKLRCHDNYSFAAIAAILHLSQKEVRSEFMAAYKFLKSKHQQLQKSA